MGIVTIYQDEKTKTWRVKWADRDILFYEFYFGVGMAKKDKLMEFFGPFKPTLVFEGTPDKKTEDAVTQLVDYIEKTYAEE